jgi:hypothetical protein
VPWHGAAQPLTGCQWLGSSVFPPKIIVVPSAKVIVFALNAHACGSFAAHPEIVILVPGVSRAL